MVKVLTRPEAVPVEAAPEQKEKGSRRDRPSDYVWGVLRLAIGWLFFWTFLDKLFGLGFSTPSGHGWINGGSPTYGFLAHGTQGPFVGFFQSLAGNPVVDWLYMVGLVGVGIALLLGIAVRPAAIAGIGMLGLMYAAASIQPANNPFLDDRLVYVIVLVGVALAGAGPYLGLGALWTRIGVVRRYSILQ